jgi:hypothetical protein
MVSLEPKDCVVSKEKEDMMDLQDPLGRRVRMGKEAFKV